MTPPTPALRKHLSSAAEHASGRLPTATSDRTRTVLVSAGLVERVGEGEFAITVVGRRALLSAAQGKALAAAAPDGRLAPDATWQTTRRLALWHLVEYRDAAGVAHPDDGDTEVGRPPRYPYATELGRSVARTLRAPAK